MQQSNPYKALPGQETDEAIHRQFFTKDLNPLPYSTDDRAAEKVRSRIRSIYGYPVQIGETKTRPKRYFARFESGPSTSTEVLAESMPLAICRLGLVIAAKRDPSTH